ncbi:hypothetical protein ILYODFUR_023928 [Ilyodon furcidens]|uniref:Uncharacterized protein n=1 Tax=Ilyodon furcidens TaxID=33524 RepID=A0ABV0SZN7_9TELE
MIQSSEQCRSSKTTFRLSLVFSQVKKKAQVQDLGVPCYQQPVKNTHLVSISAKNPKDEADFGSNQVIPKERSAVSDGHFSCVVPNLLLCKGKTGRIDLEAHTEQHI